VIASVLFLLLALTSAPASAAVGHSVLRTFSTGPNTDPRAIATDSDGNVYVVEVGARRIDKFAANGNRAPFSGGPFGYIGESSLTGTPAGPLVIESWNDVGLAVDRTGGQSEGSIYVAYTDSSPGGELLRFDPAGVFRDRASQPARFYCGAALDQSSGALYRSGTDGSAVRFPTPASGFTSNGQIDSVASCALAADSAGAVYTGSNPVKKYDASQFGAESPVASAELPVAATALAVDPDSGKVLTNDGSQIVVFNAAGVQQGAPFGNLANSRGLTADPDGNVIATDSAGGVFVFASDEVQLPTATTGASNNLSANSAEVEGTVDPDGAGTITTCEIRFGEDSGYSTGSVPCAPGGPIATPTSVNATLTGLVSGTTYHYRVFASNANGTQMASSEQTFTTPNAIEGVSTEGASAVQKDSATLSGSYTGDGQEAHYFFEWGATTAYGHTTPIPPGALAGTGSGTQAVAPVSIGGLNADTTYHYRLVVSDPDGISRGQDATFSTTPAVTGLNAEPPTAVTDTSAQLNAFFDGDSTYGTNYYFEWGRTTDYGNVSPAPPGNVVAAGSGRIHVPPVAISGLEGGSTYHFRVVASNATGTTVSGDASFKAAAAPLILSLRSSNVTAGSGELLAEINPRYGQTSYHFEGGSSIAYGHSTPVGDVGSGSANIPVSAQIEGLTPGATYHFRLVASNQYGTTTSLDQSLGFYPPACPNAQLRQETRSNELPDCRAYELVTPSFAQGTSILPTAGPNTGLATSPSRLTYGGTLGTFPEDAGESSNVLSDLYVSTRTDAGWYQKYIGLPANQTFLMGGPPESCQAVYWATSWTRLHDGTQASPQMDRIIDYNLGLPSFELGQLGDISNAPYVWDGSSGSLLGRWPSNLSQTPGGERFIGVPRASGDFSHFVFSSNVVFAPGGEATKQGMNEKCPPPQPGESWIPPSASVYDNDLATGQVVLASLKNEGSREVPFQGSVYDISTNGSHILMATEAQAEEYMTRTPVAPPNVTGPLYLRVNAAHTYEIAPGRQIHYAGSTADGATVYLTSPEQLTPDDHDSSVDLFVWHQSSPNSLTRVSVGSGGSAGDTDSCSPEGGWISDCGVGIVDFTRYTRVSLGGIAFAAGQGGNGFSDNFLASKSGDIYFESPERLVGTKGEAGQANLYLYRGGSVRYVATMKPGAYCTTVGKGFSSASGCTSGPVARMQVTPDGDHMAFVTTSQLTGYDNDERTEMYVFDPDTGRITCASCRPDGQPPVGEVLGSQNGLFLTNDGRVFFSSGDPLVAKDTDEVEDVYEFTEGKPWLISSGIGTEGPTGLAGVAGVVSLPGFVSVSANGTDVYFGTRDTLVSQDHNGAQLKIYDARTGGGFPAERGEPDCTAADECHGPVTTQAPLPPDRTSANLGRQAKTKAKKHKKKHKTKHKKHHKKNAKKRKAAGNAKQGRNHRG
jgi:hypothetical protein